MANVARFFEGLRGLEGLKPVRLHPDGETRSHYLVMLRYDASSWDGLSRDKWLEALNAEGVAASGGYSFPNFANPVFERMDLSSASSVYMMGRSAPMNYRDFAEQCPNAVRACREEAVWLMHSLFLGNGEDVDAVLRAIYKLREHHRDLL
jgi:dTDP-4-amino-4,6-dideoxygalactose transaminase